LTNCYKVPHKEQEEEVAINMEFNENLFKLQKKVAANEIIVGWFTTSKRKKKIYNYLQLTTSKRTGLPPGGSADTITGIFFTPKFLFFF